jgi:murein DD-endopeptidase MepM/ murein hydrolase activator NlpD
VFPTPGPRPISAWRPPLYPVPWAPGPHEHFLFARPIAADEVNWPIPDYRYGGIFPGSDNIIHTGIDIDAPAGTPILAAAAGEVIWAGVGLSYRRDSKTDPYGIAVAIRHNFGYNGSRLQTIYAHMQEVNVVVGQDVQAGDRIGLVGDTGLTTGPHLHFEVRVEELNYFTTRNPELWLAPPQGWGVLAGYFLTTLGNPIPAQPVRVISADEKYSWTVMTYGNSLYGIKSDPYYQENMVLSDLPAGKYKVLFDYQGSSYTRDVEIHPGTVNMITFRGEDGFAPRPTATPDLQFLATPTQTRIPK